MTSLLLLTTELRRDDPAWSLKELNLTPSDYGPKRKYQIIEIVRNDRLVEHRTDMGSVASFGDTKQLNIIGGTVDLSAGNISTGNIRLFTQNLQRVHIDYDGNVGIRTAIPVAPLTVQADASGEDTFHSLTPAAMMPHGCGIVMSLPRTLLRVSSFATARDLVVWPWYASCMGPIRLPI